MLEGYALGMQIEPVGCCAVENVSLDWAVEPFRMGTVDAQLVCASGMWIEFDAVGRGEFVVCERRLAEAMVHYLTG